MRIRSVLWPLLFLLLALAGPAGADTFVVNTTDDTTDGTCNAAHCSLREALAAAHSAAGAPHVINFDIPGAGVRTINVGTTLPLISQSVTIDGYTQPGSSPNTNATGAINAVPLIELRGNGSASGIQIINFGANPDVLVRGIIGSNFSGGVFVMPSGSLTVRGSFIGTTANGLAANNTTQNGLSTSTGTMVVGGTSPADRNVISGNQRGVSAGLAPSGGTNVLLQGNLIGLNKNGTAAVPNGVGYESFGCNGGNATGRIGGTTPAERNVISGNTETGVNISNCGVGTGNTSIGSFVRGNFIGTDVTGAAPIPNGRGVEVTSGPNIVVGGLNPGEGNLIAFNTGAGVVLSAPGQRARRARQQHPLERRPRHRHRRQRRLGQRRERRRRQPSPTSLS